MISLHVFSASSSGGISTAVSETRRHQGIKAYFFSFFARVDAIVLCHLCASAETLKYSQFFIRWLLLQLLVLTHSEWVKPCVPYVSIETVINALGSSDAVANANMGQ